MFYFLNNILDIWLSKQNICSYTLVLALKYYLSFLFILFCTFFQQDASSGQEQPMYGPDVTSRKIEVPNNKVISFTCMHIMGSIVYIASFRFCVYDTD